MSTPMSIITEAAQRIAAGGVVAFPTETVYGLGADALNPAAVRRVFELKGRPSHNPLIVHVADEAMAAKLTTSWPGEARKLAAAFWPGPLTLVLPKAPLISDEVTAGGPTVAVRCPDHPVAIALIEAAGVPLVGPSANLSGRISPTTAAHVRASFSERDVLVLDGGPCSAGIESTVLSLVGERPVVLRQGVVTAADIERVLGRGVEVGRCAGPSFKQHLEGATLPSPGMMPSHYAPESKAVLFDAGEWPDVIASATMCVVLTNQPDRQVAAPSRLIEMPSDAMSYASRLYAALRDADSMKPALIAIERPSEEGGVWDAIRDRLSRATV